MNRCSASIHSYKIHWNNLKMDILVYIFERSCPHYKHNCIHKWNPLDTKAWQNGFDSLWLHLHYHQSVTMVPHHCDHQIFLFDPRSFLCDHQSFFMWSSVIFPVIPNYFVWFSVIFVWSSVMFVWYSIIFMWSCSHNHWQFSHVLPVCRPVGSLELF